MAGTAPSVDPMERKTESEERSRSSVVMTWARDPYGMLTQVYIMPKRM